MKAEFVMKTDSGFETVVVDDVNQSGFELIAYTKDRTIERIRGLLVPRVELDNKPIFKGFLGPMFGGYRYMINGKEKYEFECTEQEKLNNTKYPVLRYETQEVYDLYSN